MTKGLSGLTSFIQYPTVADDDGEMHAINGHTLVIYRRAQTERIRTTRRRCLFLSALDMFEKHRQSAVNEHILPEERLERLAAGAYHYALTTLGCCRVPSWVSLAESRKAEGRAGAVWRVLSLLNGPGEDDSA